MESDVIIDFLNGVEAARSALERASEEGVLRVSAISAALVMADAAEEAREGTEELLRSFGILPIEGEVALVAGRYCNDGGGDELELDDCLVAAACGRLGALLLTAGRRSYPKGACELRAYE